MPWSVLFAATFFQSMDGDGTFISIGYIGLLERCLQRELSKGK